MAVSSGERGRGWDWAGEQTGPQLPQWCFISWKRKVIWRTSSKAFFPLRNQQKEKGKCRQPGSGCVEPGPSGGDDGLFASPAGVSQGRSAHHDAPSAVFPRAHSREASPEAREQAESHLTRGPGLAVGQQAGLQTLREGSQRSWCGLNVSHPFRVLFFFQLTWQKGWSLQGYFYWASPKNCHQLLLSTAGFLPPRQWCLGETILSKRKMERAMKTKGLCHFPHHHTENA